MRLATLKAVPKRPTARVALSAETPIVIRAVLVAAIEAPNNAKEPTAAARTPTKIVKMELINKRA